MLPALSCFSSSLASCFFVLLLAPAGFFLTFFCFGVYFYLHENFHFFLYFFFFFFFFLPLLVLALVLAFCFLPLIPTAPFCTSCSHGPRFAPFFLPFASSCLLFVSCLLRPVLAPSFCQTLLLAISSLTRSPSRRLGSADIIRMPYVSKC